MDLVSLVVNVVSGGVVGYVTNTIALNMLFEKYPVIGGAAILKEREKLEVSISDLIENELVKPKVLLEEIQKEEFRLAFGDLITHIVKNTISENIKDVELVNEIYGFDETSVNLRAFLVENRENILKPSLDILYDNLYIADSLSEEQLKNIIEKLFEIITFSFKENITSVLEEIYKEFSSQKLHNHISEEIADKMIDNLVSEKLHKSIEKEFETKSDTYLDAIYEILELDKTVEKVILNLKDKTFYEIFGRKDSRNLTEQVIKRLVEFLNTEKGKSILEDSLSAVVKLLKGIDRPLSSLLTEAIESKLLDFIDQNLPDFITRFENWVMQNKSEIDSLINSAIDEHLGSENLVKQLVGVMFVRKISERYEVVERGISKAKKIVDSAKPEIVELVRRFLDNTTISDLMAYFEKIIPAEALTDALLKNIYEYLPEINLNFFDAYFDNKIGNLPGLEKIDFSRFFREEVFTLVKTKIKDNLLFDPKINSAVKTILKAEFKKLNNSEIGILIKKEDLYKYEDLLFEVINSSEIKSAFVNEISAEIINLTKEKTINEIISPNIRSDLEDKLSGFYNQKISEFLKLIEREKIENLGESIGSFYEKFSKQGTFPAQANNVILSKIVQMISDSGLLEGKVHLAVKESLQRLSEPELKNELEEFMGNQLQPITVFGAVLGATVGALLFYSSYIPGVSTYTTGWWGFLSAPMVYALTGIGTNWLAIKMVFRPYNEIRIPFLNWKLPFTPGLFPGRKPQLGESLANFVDKRILSKDTIRHILSKYGSKWEVLLKSFITKDDYYVLNDLLVEYRRDISGEMVPGLLDLGFEQVNNNRFEVSGYLVQEAEKLNFSQVNLGMIKDEVMEKIDNSRGEIKNYLRQLHEKLAHSGRTLNEVLPATVLEATGEMVRDVTKKALEELTVIIDNDQQFYRHTADISSRFDQYMDINLKELISNSHDGDYNNKIVSFIEQVLKSDELQDFIVTQLKTNVIGRGLSTEKQIGRLFDGKVITAILKESDFMMDYISQYILKTAAAKRKELARAVLEDIEDQGLLETMMVKFGGVEKDVLGVVDVIVSEKLEPYLEFKKKELQSLFNNYIINDLSAKKLSDLGIDGEILNPEILKNLVKEKILENSDALAAINTLIHSLLEELLENFTVRDVLGMLGIDSIYDFIRRFDDEVNIIRKSVYHNLNSKKNEVNIIITAVSENILNNIIYKRKLRDLLKNLDKEKVSAEIDKAVELIFSSESLKYAREKNLDTFVSILENKGIGEVINYEILRKDLADVIACLTQSGDGIRSRKFRKDIQSATSDAIEKFSAIMETNFEKETKDTILDIIIKTVLYSMESNSDQLVEPIEIRKIVKREVLKMDARKIEDMFSFANPIFNTLIMYGAIGGIVGVIVGIAGLF